MNNLVSFLSDSRLTQDIACLLTFLQQSFNQDNFFKAFPNAILKATLDELKFDFDNEKTLSITLKNDLKKKKFNVPNTLLSAIGFPPNKLTEKLQHDQFLESELTLKEALEKNIAPHNQTIIHLTITNSIHSLQEKNFQRHENSEKEIEIQLFFIFLKSTIQQFAFTKNHTSSSSDSLVSTAAHLTALFISNLNNVMTSLKETLTSSTVFSYGVLFTKLMNLTPQSNQKSIRQLLDALIENALERPLHIKYDFFKRAFFSEEGFSTIVYDRDDYRFIQTCSKNFNSLVEHYQNFVQLIEALTAHHHKINEIIDLAVKLKKATDTYFQSVLYNIVFNFPNADVFTTFKNVVESEISIFQKKHPCSTEVNGILNKILNALARIVPHFLISREQRARFFHPGEARIFLKIENSVPSMKI
ncbi:hypothetical protein [Rickettsiella grylli]|uniref:Uncharacterized protein n=1 Tax=Rickettsiella grylli TaxID=59196 RepID=A8PKT9_9COXI|nr:hypothetical protein [Rickettsiella grylli]EDP46041.1 hypothetical protein RICGR_0071 [Rickettsiella grylli]